MMPTNASRDDWALALARFGNCLRPDWDVPGIRSAIHQARPLASREDIGIALIELTKRDDIKTPALLSQDGPHWHTGRTPNARPPKSKCADHPDEYVPCRMCPVEQYGATDVDTLGPLSAEQIEINRRGAQIVRDALSERAGR